MEHSYLLQVLSIALTLALAGGLMVIIAVAVSPLISTAELMPVAAARSSALPPAAAPAVLVARNPAEEETRVMAPYVAAQTWEAGRMPNAALEIGERREPRGGRGAAEPARSFA